MDNPIAFRLAGNDLPDALASAPVVDIQRLASAILSALAQRSTSTSLLVGYAELAALTTLSLRTLKAMNSSGKLPPPLKIGGRILWRRADIEDWIATGAPDRVTWLARHAASEAAARR